MLTSAYSQPGTFYWTCPADVVTVAVELWGGGGAGGGGKPLSYGYGGGGGAGGQYSTKSASVTESAVYTITVGEGGVGSVHADGEDGHASIFAPEGMSQVSALGGAGGKKYLNGATGGVATSTGGLYDICYAGGSGADGTTSYSGGGGGGAGSTGTGNSGVETTGGAAKTASGGAGGSGTTSTSGDGWSGNHYGGGGSGATCSGTPGGGQHGYAKITYHYSYTTTLSEVVALDDNDVDERSSSEERGKGSTPVGYKGVFVASNTSQNASFIVTIPAESTFCVLGIADWCNRNVNLITGTTLDGQAGTLIRFGTWTSARETITTYRFKSFGTGAKTFAIGRSSAIAEGATYMFMFMKHVNQTSPIRASNTTGTNNHADLTSASLASSTTDLVTIFGSGDNGHGSVETTFSGQTPVTSGTFNTADYGAAYFQGTGITNVGKCHGTAMVMHVITVRSGISSVYASESLMEYDTDNERIRVGRIVNDTATLNDGWSYQITSAPAQQYSTVFAENLIANGSFDRLVNLRKNVSESLVETDNVDEIAGLKKTLTDSPTVTDSLSTNINERRTLSDAFILDSIGTVSGFVQHKSYSTIIAESLIATDTMTRKIVSRRTLTGTLFLAATNSQGMYNQHFYESPVITDTIIKKLNVARSFSSTLGLNSTVSGSAGKRVTTVLAESLIETTQFIRQTRYTRALYESWTWAGGQSNRTQHFRYPTDDVLLTETRNLWLNKQIHLSEILRPSDSYSSHAPKQTKILYESNIIMDITTRGQSVYHRTFSEQITTEDIWVQIPLITKTEVYGAMEVIRLGTVKFSLS
jgi:hypothetical protein